MSLNDSLQLVRTVLDNERKIKEKQEIKSKIYEDGDKKQHEIYCQYSKKINKIEEEQRNAKHEYQEKIDNQTNKIREEINEIHKISVKVGRIIHFLEAKNSKMDFDVTQVKGYRTYGKVNPVEILDIIEEQYLNMALYLGECDRKVNKYVLSIAGKSLIGGSYNERFSEILELEYDYGTSIDASRNNIEKDVKFFPTKEFAIAYAKKHGLLGIEKKFMKKYQEVKNECEQVNEKYELTDFTQIIKVEDAQ